MKLAQLNIAQAKYAIDKPEMKEFVDNLDNINGIAEQSKGFVWRLSDDSGDATSIVAFDDPNILINMSVWQDVESLKNFMFRTHHRDFMRRKALWFERSNLDTYVLWWVADGHIPTIDEAVERLMYLREHTDSPYAFTFKSNFSADEVLDYLPKEFSGD